ncbi:MAG: metal ABC transporter permease [Pseudomonadota bacterium]
MSELFVPFTYDYMLKAMFVSALVGGVCAFLSAYLMLKGWSLMGDALAHAVVPGVAGAYILGLPFAAGAFIAGLLAAAGMHVVNQVTRLRQDAVIGIVFTSFFAAGLLMVSLFPTSVNVTTIIMGNVLAIPDADALQVALITLISLTVLLAFWRDLMLVFFDEAYARTVGLRVDALKVLFFTLLSACTVAALQTVGAFLVIAMVVTPGATAYLLTDRFHLLLILSVTIGAGTSFFGAYISYFLDGATGGIIVCTQTLVFLAAFIFAPKHGILATQRAAQSVVVGEEGRQRADGKATGEAAP